MSWSNLYSQIPYLAFVIEKSTNQNVVCYAGNIQYDPDTNQKVFRPDFPIDIFWMDIDPEYQQRARASGRSNDRVELSWVERKMAYGFRLESYQGQKVIGRIEACPDREISFHYNEETQEVYALTKIHNQWCLLKYIHLQLDNEPAGYLQSIFNWQSFRPDWVELHGIHLETQQDMVERIYPD